MKTLLSIAALFISGVIFAQPVTKIPNDLRVVGEIVVTDSVKSNTGYFVKVGPDWVPVTGGGGGSTPTLNAVLNEDNVTDGANINISNGDAIYMDNGSSIRKGTTDAFTGGAQGVAMVCSIQYELKWEAGRLYIMHQDGFTIREVRYTFTESPSTTDDGSKGFVVGSKWVMDNGLEWVCADSTTGAAVWDTATLWDEADGVVYPIATDTVEANFLRADNFHFGSDSVFFSRYVDVGVDLAQYIVRGIDGSIAGFTFGNATGNPSGIFSISSNVLADPSYPESGMNYQGQSANIFSDGLDAGSYYHTRLYLDTLGSNWYNSSPFGNVEVRIDSAAAFLVTGATADFTLNDSLTVSAPTTNITGNLTVDGDYPFTTAFLDIGFGVIPFVGSGIAFGDGVFIDGTGDFTGIGAALYDRTVLSGYLSANRTNYAKIDSTSVRFLATKVGQASSTFEFFGDTTTSGANQLFAVNSLIEGKGEVGVHGSLIDGFPRLYLMVDGLDGPKSTMTFDSTQIYLKSPYFGIESSVAIGRYDGIVPSFTVVGNDFNSLTFAEYGSLTGSSGFSLAVSDTSSEAYGSGLAKFNVEEGFSVIARNDGDTRNTSLLVNNNTVGIYGSDGAQVTLSPIDGFRIQPVGFVVDSGYVLTATDVSGTAEWQNSISVDHYGSNTCDTIASATTITLGTSNNIVITGTADIDSINTASATANFQIVYIEFTGTAAIDGLTDGTNLRLEANMSYLPTATVTLQRRGNYFYELSRSSNGNP